MKLKVAYEAYTKEELDNISKSPKKKVLLVGPYRNTVESRFTSMPLGIARLGSYLNSHGHTAHLYDININKVPLENFIKDNYYDIIGFSPLHCSLEHDLGAIHLARKICPNTLIGVGGVEATLNYKQILDNAPIDFVVLAEGEDTMLDLCNGKPIQEIDGIIWRKYAKPITRERLWSYNKDMDYGAMKFDGYWNQTMKLYDNPDEEEIKTARIFTMSHCPMNCTFCSVKQYHKSACGKTVKSVKLNADQMIHCIRNLLKTYPDLKTVFFVEDEFCIDKKRVFEFCEKAKEFNLTYICLARIDSMDEDIVKAMAGVGFRVISFGIESLSQRACDSLNKKQDCSVINKNVDLLIKYKIKPYSTFMLFQPDTKMKDLLIDYHGLNKLCNEKGMGLSIEPYIMPLHGSDLYERTTQSFQYMMYKVPGTNIEIKKPVAAYPKDPTVKKIMLEFEERFYKYREEKAKEAGHKEKTWQAKCILDVVGQILKEKGYLK